MASDWFSSRIALFLVPSIFPSIVTSFPIHAEEKQPHNTTFPPPCFTVHMMCSGWWDFLHTWRFALGQKKKNPHWSHLTTAACSTCCTQWKTWLLLSFFQQCLFFPRHSLTEARFVEFSTCSRPVDRFSWGVDFCSSSSWLLLWLPQ